jgi:hypothetical protein
MRLARGSVTYTTRLGTQLKTMPTRVTASGSADSAAAAAMPWIGVNEPGAAIPSTPFWTWTCTTLPSESAAKKTARPVPSGDFVTSEVARAGATSPCVEAGPRLVTSPAKTPPATGSGGPLNGAPVDHIVP